MEFKKLEAPGETPLLRFYDLTKTELTLWASEDIKQGKSTKVLYFDIDTDYVKFLQEDIKTLLPYLQSFAEMGQLEPQEPISVTAAREDGDALLQRYSESQEKNIVPIEPTLQGGSLLEESIKKTASLVRQAEKQEERIDDLVETTARMNFKNYEQEKRIQALEQLLRTWVEFGLSSDVDGSAAWAELNFKTVQLLHEG